MLRAQRRDPAKAQAKCAFATNYPLANRQLRSPLILRYRMQRDKPFFYIPLRSFKKSLNSNPCTSGQRIGLNGGGDMSTLSYHFPEFAIGAVRARIRSVRPWNPPSGG